MSDKKALKPIKSLDRERSTGEHYWMCPNCKNRVGGFYITGGGYNDWGYKEDKFCSECGTKIKWSL
jgi:hypothetical protein